MMAIEAQYKLHAQIPAINPNRNNKQWEYHKTEGMFMVDQ